MKYFLSIYAALLLSTAVFAQEQTKAEIPVQGLCEMCKMRIEKAAQGKGVDSATWEVATRNLTVYFNPDQTSLQKIEQRIADVGHDTRDVKAKDYIYNDLPECCHYRDEKVAAAHENPASRAIMGVVVKEDKKGNFEPLAGASISLPSGEGTSTSENGYFELELPNESASLSISYAGFSSKDINVTAGQHLNIVLDENNALQEVRVVSNNTGTRVSAVNVLRTQVMNEQELAKAACCNLSESFETNPSVDVAYSDAVTGSKQIQMLGLSGNYAQLTIESLPGPRGIATPLGLNSIPGTWVESIQLSKGTGSVVNGYESMSGQINVELKKPQNSERLYANAYVNSMGKTDLNLNLSQPVGKKWSTALLLHDAWFQNNNMDFNKDGFRDLPTGNLFTAMNRWQYMGTNGLMGQFGFRYLTDDKTGGQTDFDPAAHKLGSDKYGLGINTNRWDAFGKIGYVFPKKKFKSIGLQLSTFHHAIDAYFGQTPYVASQQNFYANLIYQSIISDTRHKFRTGISWVYDDFDERYNSNPYLRTEKVPGAFFEYTWSPSDKFDMIAGVRGDWHNLFGFFATPRLHLRYQPVKGTVIRIAAGRGQRTASIFAENSSVFVSARTVSIIPSAGGRAYGLNPEVAWNEGISVDQDFRLFDRKASLGIDFFRTDFQDQVIVDREDPRTVKFYNLVGKSYSNSFQTQLNYELVHSLNMRLAYRFYDVKTTYSGELKDAPLIAKDRGFVNLAYVLRNWNFDYTVTFNGTKRIPSTAGNPVQYQRPVRSASFVTMNAQISVTMGNKFPIDLYVGGENLTNYFQKKAILGVDQPFGNSFDASMVWGPVSGRMFYGGVRLKLK